MKKRYKTRSPTLIAEEMTRSTTYFRSGAGAVTRSPESP